MDSTGEITMSNDRILQKEEFIQRYVLNRALTKMETIVLKDENGRGTHLEDAVSPVWMVKDAAEAWDAIRKECDK
jgi:hypothetical protein